MNYDILQLQDELQFNRQQAKQGGCTKLHAPSNKINMAFNKALLPTRNNINLVDPNKIDPRKTSHPLIVRSGVLKAINDPKLKKNNRALSRESTFLSQGEGILRSIAQPPINISHTKLHPPGHPTAVDKMAGVHTMSTITSRTSTNTDITTSKNNVPEFKQISAYDRCLVIGCPTLPEK